MKHETSDLQKFANDSGGKLVGKSYLILIYIVRSRVSPNNICRIGMTSCAGTVSFKILSSACQSGFPSIKTEGQYE